MSRAIPHVEFTVIQDDVAEQEADVLVNAAGTSLRMESGVAGALRRTAPEEINDEATSKGPVDLGGVAGVDLRDGARIVCRGLATFDPDSLDDVRFVAYADDEYETVRAVADEIRDG